MAAPETASNAEINKNTLRRMINEFWNEGKTEIAGDLVTEGFERTELFSDETTIGPDGLRQAATTWRGAFPDCQLTLVEILAENDRLSCHWTFKGTHTGQLNEIPPSGRPVNVEGLSILQFVDGKADRETVATDMLTLMTQLGVVTS